MGKSVFANGLEIAGGASDNLVIAALPDVCLSPPPSPAGPIPIPYPNSSKSKDLQKGSKDVCIGSKAVCLGSKSHYKSSPLGDEACTKALGMNVIDHVNSGKTYCQAFSMNVNTEDEPVTRTTDISTSNHSGPQPGGCAVPMVQTGGVSPPGPPEPLCECCGAPAHSAEQAAGAEMSAGEWYNPPLRPKSPPTARDRKAARVLENAKTLLDWSKEYDCGNAHPEDSKDPCAKHYAMKDSTKKSRKDFSDMVSPLTSKDVLVEQYGPTVGGKAFANGERLREARKAGSASDAHLTPLAAGGCPIGAGNTNPVFGEECHFIEGQLGEVQGDIKKIHNGNFR